MECQQVRRCLKLEERLYWRLLCAELSIRTTCSMRQKFSAHWTDTRRKLSLSLASISFRSSTTYTGGCFLPCHSSTPLYKYPGWLLPLLQRNSRYNHRKDNRRLHHWVFPTVVDGILGRMPFVRFWSTNCAQSSRRTGYDVHECDVIYEYRYIFLA